MNFSNVEYPSNRKFGLFFALIFLVLSFFAHDKDKFWFGQIFCVLGFVFFITAFVRPSLLISLNIMWTKLGLLLGMIVSPFVIAMIFFGMITPLSLVMKLFSRDELRLKLIERDTHWQSKQSESDQHNGFKQQF